MISDEVEDMVSHNLYSDLTGFDIPLFSFQFFSALVFFTYFCHMRNLTGKFLKLHLGYQLPFQKIKTNREIFQPSFWHFPLSAFDFPARKIASSFISSRSFVFMCVII